MKAIHLVLTALSVLVADVTSGQSIYEPYFFTTLAGLALNSGTNDDTGNAARFNQPWGIALDSADNVYVADTLNQTIRKITPGGVATTLAGVAGSAGFNDGPASTALFSRPTGVAVNSAGTVVYVADYNNQLIRQISGGVVSTLAGSIGVLGTNDDTGTLAQFHNPFGVALNSAGTVLYVSDQNNQTIRRIIISSGAVTTLAGAAGVNGSTDDGNNLNARFNTPKGIAVDGGGNVYVADAGNFTVRKIAASGGVSTLAGSVFTPGFNDGAGSGALFSRLQSISPFGGPCGVAADSGGNVYVTDQGNHTIRKITSGGSVTTLAGLALTSGSDDGTGSAARFYDPAGVAVDGAGNLCVADTLNHTIRVGTTIPNCVAGETWTARDSSRGWDSVASSADGTKLVAGVYGGQIYTSSDSGATWTARDSSRTWYSVASSADGTKLVAVVPIGQIYTSSDSGATWMARDSNRNWYSVASSGDGTKLVAVVGGGQIYTSSDSGATWTVQPSAPSANWSSVASSADGTKLIAVEEGSGSGGQIYISGNSGVTWTAQNSGSRDWRSVASSADGTKLVAVEYDGQIYTSSDSGVTWTAQNSGSRDWQSVASSADGMKLVAVEYGGQIYTSSDSGVTWTARDSNRNWYSVASSADGNKLVTVVDGGQIYTSSCTQPPVITCATNKTVECGTAWTFDLPVIADTCGGTNVAILNTVTNGLCPQTITRTWAITDACGNSNTCSQTVTLVDTTPPDINCPTNKTVGDGTAWTFDTPTAVDGCSGTNVTVGILSTVTNVPSQTITRTWLASDLCGNTNTCSQTVTVINVETPCVPGETWTARDSSRTWNSVASSWDGTKLVAVDGGFVSGGQIYTSSDSGVNWTAQNSGNQYWTSVASSWDGTKLVAVVGGGQIYTSSDSGANWTARDSSRTWNSVASSWDGTKLVAVVGGGQIYTSSDSGANWTAHDSNRTWWSVASSADGTKLVAGVYGGQIYTSSDSGVTWMARDSNRNWYSVASSADGSKLVAGVRGGQIYTSTDLGANWTVQAGSSIQSWQSVASSSDGNELVAAAYGGFIYISSNSGMTWTARDSNRDWYSVASSWDGTKLVAGVQGGQIYTSACTQTNVAGQCVPAPANLALWLPFDETSGNTSANLVPGGNNGTQVGSPVVASGYVDHSLNFDGVSQYVEVPSYNGINPGTGDLSIDAWVKRDLSSGAATRVIVDKRDPTTYIGYSLVIYSGNLLFQMTSAANSPANYLDTNSVPADNQWHFVAVTVNRSPTNSIVRFYRDGTPGATSSTSGSPGSLNNTNSLLIGNTFVIGASPWMGGIDEAEMFRRALSPTEIATIFNAGSAGKCKTPECVPAPPKLILWLPFDETSGTNSYNIAPGHGANNGIQVNYPTVINGYVDHALYFNGVNQYVEVPSYSSINFGTSDFSIDAWVTRDPSDDGTSVRIIVDKRDESSSVTGYALFLGAGGALGFQLADGNYANYSSSLAVPNDRQWHYVVVTVTRHNTNGIVFYLDGVADSVLRDPTPYSGSVSSSVPLRIGASSSSASFNFFGGIDEVELFDYVLTPSDVASIFNAGSAGKCKTSSVIPLVVTCSTNKTVECGSDWNFDLPTATGAGVIITSAGFVTNGVCPKAITQNWLIADAYGNSNACSQTVTLVDTTPPVIECLTNTIIVPLNKDCQLEIPTIRPKVSDNCTPASQLTYTQSPAAGEIVPGPCHDVIVTVIDACGNSSKCQVQVCGEDKTPPTLTYPKSLTATNCVVPDVLPFVSASDPCTPLNKLAFTQSPPVGTPIAAGGNIVTVTVTDPSGNTSTAFIPLTGSGTQSFLDVMFNTGVDGNKAVLPSYSVDPHYTVGSVPIGTPTGPDYYNAPDAIVNNNFNWTPLPPITLSGWLTPSVGSLPSSGSFTYTNHFTLPSDMDPLTASISGRWAVLNTSQGEMYLNGNSTPVASIAQNFNGSHWEYFTINSGFLGFPADNKITFVVTSLGPYLRVEFTSAAANCSTCTPPAIVYGTPDQSLPVNGTTVFSVNVWGTPPLTIQWYHNGQPLANSGHYSGVNTATLTVTSVDYPDAGNYSVVVSNPCGETADKSIKLTVTKSPVLPWEWWNFSRIDKPLAATIGDHDLIFVGSNDPDHYTPGTYSVVTPFDVGLPSVAGKNPNVLYLSPGARLKLPFIGPTDSTSLGNYTFVIDFYVPSDDATDATTLFDVSNPEGSLSLMLDPDNFLRMRTPTAGGSSIILTSIMPVRSNEWNRVALVVDSDDTNIHGIYDQASSGNLTSYLYVNGEFTGSADIHASSGLITTGSVATVFSSLEGTTGKSYVADIKFFADAMMPQIIAEWGNPDNGPISLTKIGTGTLTLSTSMKNGMVQISWTADDEYTLEETSALNGEWKKSAANFVEMQNPLNGMATFTATVSPTSGDPVKFYRLVGLLLPTVQK